METYFMFGRYNAESVRDASPNRTSKAERLINELGGKVKAMYALIGQFDLVLIVELPSVEDAMKASLGLNMLTGITFTTAPAMSVDDFDKIFAKK